MLLYLRVAMRPSGSTVLLTRPLKVFGLRVSKYYSPLARLLASEGRTALGVNYFLLRRRSSCAPVATDDEGSLFLRERVDVFREQGYSLDPGEILVRGDRHLYSVANEGDSASQIRTSTSEHVEQK